MLFRSGAPAANADGEVPPNVFVKRLDAASARWMSSNYDARGWVKTEREYSGNGEGFWSRIYAPMYGPNGEVSAEWSDTGGYLDMKALDCVAGQSQFDNGTCYLSEDGILWRELAPNSVTVIGDEPPGVAVDYTSDDRGATFYGKSRKTQIFSFMFPGEADTSFIGSITVKKKRWDFRLELTTDGSDQLQDLAIVVKSIKRIPVRAPTFNLSDPDPLTTVTIDRYHGTVVLGSR